MTNVRAVEIRRARDDDLPAVVALLSASLTWETNATFSAFFHWKHRENPFGVSPAWVALDGDRVVGYRTFLRWEFDHPDGRARRAVRAVDTATHPDYQGRGVFRSLTLAAVEELVADDVDFVFNTPNAQSRPGYLRMGWETVGRLPLSVRVRGPLGAMHMLSSRVPAQRWPAECTVGRPAVDALADERIEHLTTQPPLGLRTRRSAAFLRWRFGFAPLGYRVLGLTDDPRDGIAIFRLRHRGRATEAAVCELLASPSATRRLVTRVCRETGADYAVRVGNPDVRAGLLPLPKQGPILTYRPLRDTSAAPLLDRWQLSLGDIELL